MLKPIATLAIAALLVATASVRAEDATSTAPPTYDAALAASLGADDNGMRKFVFVLLKTGPTKVPAGPERDAMFAGHFANINRLAADGKLALAGPFDGKDGWRGMFVFAVADIEEARALVATDPVIVKGEMVAEYHDYYGSAALMQINATHAKIARSHP